MDLVSLSLSTAPVQTTALAFGEARMDAFRSVTLKLGARSSFRKDWQHLLHTNILKTWWSSLDTPATEIISHLEQRPHRADTQTGLGPAFKLPAPMTSCITWKKLTAREQNCGCSHLQTEHVLALDRNSTQALQLGMLRRCCSILPCNNMKRKLSRKAVNQIRLIKQFLTNGVAHKNFIKTSSAKFISWVCHCYFFLFSSDNYYIRN